MRKERRARSRTVSRLREAPSRRCRSGRRCGVKFDAAEIAVPAGKSQIHVAWSVPDGTAINDDAPVQRALGLERRPRLRRQPTSTVTAKTSPTDSTSPSSVIAGASGGQLVGDIDLVVCDIETHAVCVPI